MKPEQNGVYDLIVIGGGAAGFFCAVQAAEMRPGLKILILERSTKLLAKVKISGGGRCNVTHHCYDPVHLSRHYPRGERPLRSIFTRYDVQQTIGWFRSKGVEFTVEADGRMFPATNDSRTIIDCFIQQAIRLGIRIETGEGVERLSSSGAVIEVYSSRRKLIGKSVLIAVGGNPALHFYEWIAALGHAIVPPIPSLFTFNDSERKFADLMGVAVSNAEVRIAGTRFSRQGPVLITHWGLSGPAVIRLSAWAAAYLHSINYGFTALVNWTGLMNEDGIRSFLAEHKKARSRQKVISNPLFSLPQRLWRRFCELSEIEEHEIWAELPQRNINRMIEYLIRCPFRIKGKTTFKEEFVTCGGVDLKEVDMESMESKKIRGVYFAGEVLNIDGETGGFNFQAAWSTAYLAARAIAASHAAIDR